MKRFFQNLTLFIVALAVGLGVAEVTLRIFDPFEIRVRGDRIVLPSNVEWVFEGPEGGQLDAEISHRKNNIGFRGEDYHEWDDRLRVFAVGGSTTECLYLGEGHTWADLLKVKLQSSFPRIWVNNAGLDGHSTFGHRILLDDHISGLEPDLLIYLTGINDIARQDLSRTELKTVRARTLESLSSHSELFALLANLRRSIAASERRIAHNTEGLNDTWLVDWEISPETLESETAFAAQFVDDYRNRLTKLVEASRQAGAAVILVTQPTLYGGGHDDRTGLDLSRIYVDSVDGATAWTILEQYNDAMRSVANELDVPLVDLARLLPKSSYYFYDTIHFTNDGAQRVADILYGHICERMAGLFPDHNTQPCDSS